MDKLHKKINSKDPMRIEDHQNPRGNMTKQSYMDGWPINNRN